MPINFANPAPYMLQCEIAWVGRARNIDFLSDVLIQGRNRHLRH